MEYQPDSCRNVRLEAQQKRSFWGKLQNMLPLHQDLECLFHGQRVLTGVCIEPPVKNLLLHLVVVFSVPDEVPAGRYFAPC